MQRASLFSAAAAALLLCCLPCARAYRVVLTFEQSNACEQQPPSCVSVAKCYGRRLVLDMDGCSGVVAQDDVQWLKSWFSSSMDGIADVEYDTMVAAGYISSQNSVLYADAGSLPSGYYNSALQAAASYDASTLDELNAAMATSSGASSPSPASDAYTNPLNLLQWNLDSISAKANYWDEGMYGKGHVVAVLDSGTASTAAPAIGMLLNGFDFISDPEVALDGDGRDMNAFDPGDKKAGECEASSWHGTYVTSILAAKHQENVFKGIAPQAPILPVRVLGKCKTGYASDVADAIAWAVGASIIGMDSNRLYPARSIVMAFTGKGQCPSYLQSVITMARDVYNATLFAAAGNEGLDASQYFPANCEGVFSVGAADRTGAQTPYTSKNADVYLPGGTWEDPVPCLGPTLQVGGCVGTSMAVSHAGGTWALENTDNAWVDPATLPATTTPEQAAFMDALPRSTYELAAPDSAAYLQAAAEGSTCNSPSVLYADGFCGIRMNTSSDLRTIWTLGYTAVELQPGTYSDATKHCSLVANNTNRITGFASTYIYTPTPDGVNWNCAGGAVKPFSVAAGFNLSIANLKITNPGSITCSGAGATLQLNNISITGTVSAGSTVISVTSNCSIATLGYLTFVPTTGSPAYILYMDGIDVSRSSIGGEYFRNDGTWASVGVTTNAAIFLQLPALQATEWVWTIKSIESPMGNIGSATTAGGAIVLVNARVAIPSINVKIISSSTPSMQFIMTNSHVRMTDKVNRWAAALCYYCAYNMFASLDAASTLTFDSSMTEFNLYYGRHPIHIRGGKVFMRANNVNIVGNVGAPFGLYDGAYMEWTGSNAVFSRNTGVAAVIFRVMGGSVLNFSGSNHTFYDSSGLGYYAHEFGMSSGFAGAQNASAGIFFVQNSTLLLQASSVSFVQSHNTHAIYATQNSRVLVSGKNITFKDSTGFGQMAYEQTVGSVILLNNSMLTFQDGADVSFQNNVLTPLLMWYSMDGGNSSMLADFLNRTSMALANFNGAAFNASDINPSVVQSSSSAGSMQFTSAGQYVSLPVDNLNLMSAMLRGGISISLWFRMSSASGSSARVFDFCTGDWGTAPGYRLSFGRATTTTNLLFSATNPGGGSTSYTYSSRNVIDSAWHHMVWQITRDSTGSVWIDNVMVCNACMAGAFGSSSVGALNNGMTGAPYNGPSNVFRFTRATFGRSCTVSGDGWFLGAVDDFRIYSRVLTASEVGTLYTRVPTGLASNIFLSDPVTSANGSAIAVLGQSSVSMNSSAVKFACTNNFAASYGGCIFLDRFANVSLGAADSPAAGSSSSSLVFVNNSAVLGGGAIQVDLTYVGLNMSNLDGTGNTVLEGDGGFISITGGASYVYANSTWSNIRCQGNAALQGRGGCIYISYNETYTNIPHDINILNPVFAGGNLAALNNSNILFVDDPWVKISGAVVLLNSSDAYLRGLDVGSRCLNRYPCTLDAGHYTGDSNPGFQGRCPAGTAVDPYGAAGACVKVYNTWDNIRIPADFRTESNFLLLPGFYTNTAWYFCNFVFTVTGAYSSVNFTGLGHFSASGQLLDNRDAAMFDCQDVGYGLTINANFRARLTGIGFARSIRSVYCLGCTLQMENVQVRNAATGAVPAIETVTSGGSNVGLVTRGFLAVNFPRQTGGNTVQLVNIDPSKSEFGGTLWNVDSAGLASASSASLRVSCSTSATSLKWNVANTTISGARSTSAAVSYGYGIQINSCSVSMQHLHASSSVRLLGVLSLETGSSLNVTGSVTLNSVASVAVFQQSSASNSISLVNIPMAVTNGSAIQTAFLLVAGGKVSASVRDLAWTSHVTSTSNYASIMTMPGSGCSATWNCTNCTVSNISNSNSGGLFAIPAGSSLDFTGINSTYSSVSSGGNGGIFYVAGTSARLSISGSNVTFSRSRAGGPAGGGVIFADSGASVTIAGTSISFLDSNASVGGAIACNASRVSVTASDATFRGNDANYTSDATAWYRFDDSATSMLLDSSPNGYHLSSTATNGTFFDGANVTLGTGSMRFTNSYRQWVNVPLDVNPSSLFYSTSRGLSFSFWFRMDTVSGTAAKIFDFADGSTAYTANPTYYMFVGRSTTTANIVFNIMNTVYTTTTGTAVNGAWHHVAWNILGSGVWTIYLDNALVCSSCATRVIPASIAWSRQTFGRGSFTTDGTFVGNIDDFRIYQRQLSSAEVAVLWSSKGTVIAGNGGAISLTGGAVLEVAASSPTFMQNYATSLGGAIYADRTSSVSLAATTSSAADAVKFTSNAAEQGGGAIYEVMSSAPLNLTNVVATGNRASNGSGGFLAIVNSAPVSTAYASSWWQNLRCTSNLAPNGSGGCIYVGNNESDTRLVPYEVNVISPTFDFNTNDASSGDIIFGGSWTYLEGKVTLNSSNDLVLSNASPYCPSGYACMVSDFYSGDPNPSYNGTYGIRCAPGTFFNAATSSCQSCVAGSTYTSAPGRTACRTCSICPTGTTTLRACTLTTDTVCQCAPGMYMAANLSCIACDAGSYSSSYAAPSCTPCSVGTFSNTTRASTCIACSSGTYLSVSGGTACTKCPAGSYAPSAGSLTCLGCPGGKYQNQTGASFCMSCPVGYASTKP